MFDGRFFAKHSTRTSSRLTRSFCVMGTPSREYHTSCTYLADCLMKRSNSRSVIRTFLVKGKIPI